MSYAIVKAKMRQCSVGQGGFFCGTLRTRGISGCDQKKYRWVYDCGSINKTELEREIKREIPSGCTVNSLYFSHLHNDHINGLDILMNRCKVKQIVLPYLNESDKYFTILNHFYLFRSNEISYDQFEFAHQMIMNPTHFYIDQKIETLIQVQAVSIESEGDGKSEDDADLDADASVDAGAREDADPLEENFRTTWRPNLVSATGDEPKEGVGAFVASADAVETVRIPDLLFDWDFVPHIYPMTGSQYDIFKHEVSKITGKNLDHKLYEDEIYDIADTMDKLKNLLKCYETVMSNVNPMSMSLYVGPKLYANGKWYQNRPTMCLKFGDYTLRGVHNDYGGSCIDKSKHQSTMSLIPKPYYYPYYIRGLECGWILTGDSDFKTSNKLETQKSRFKFFKNRYKKYMSFVKIVMIPHHGSKYNVTRKFFKLFERPYMAYVAAGPTKKHPSSNVVRMACASALFHIVGTDSTSKLTLRSRWWFSQH